jgi:Saccharopine dehydrogenase NADP binding domain
MTKASNQKTVVLGGYGTFGSLISEQLLNSTNVVIAGRNQKTGEKFADAIGASFVLCNVKDTGSLQKAISGAFIVINASGPFLPNEYSIPQTCIEENCHYIDLADNREYVKEFKQLDSLAKAKEVFVCTGVSTTPAVTYALISELRAQFQDIHSIKIYLSAGNKNEAGVSTFESILSYAGVPIQVWMNCQWELFSGWGLSETINFPPPIGKRFVQLCDVPDLELFPKLFEANEVIFKAGVELPIFNTGLSVLAQVKEHIPQINLLSLAKPLVEASQLFKNFGSFSGGVLVKLGDKNGNSKTLAFVTSQNGPRLPTAAAVLLTKKILLKGPPKYGAFPCVGFISLDEFQNYLQPFGFQLISQQRE